MLDKPVTGSLFTGCCNYFQRARKIKSIPIFKLPDDKEGVSHDKHISLQK